MLTFLNKCIARMTRSSIVGVLLLIVISATLFAPLAAHAQSAGVPAQVAQVADCDIWEILQLKCILLGVNNFLGLLVWLFGFMISFVGTVFSIFAAFALSGALYDQPVIDAGWTIIRDVANISFIFILLYIGIATILDITSHDTTKLLARVVIAALLINFSLALAKVPIDAGNIFAISFYNAINATEIQGLDDLNTALAPTDVAAKIMDTLSPHRLFTSSAVGADANNIEEVLASILFTQVFQIIALLLLLYVFVTGVIIFLTRIVWLWVLLIFSPAAFIAYGANFTSIWKQWLSKLTNYSIVAPAYMFFIYLTVRLADSPFTQIAFQQSFEQNFNQNAGAMAGLSTWASGNAMFIVAYLVVLGVLQGGAKVAKQLGVAGAGALDKVYNQTVGMAKTAVVGVATGGAGLVAGAAISAGQYGASTVSAGAQVGRQYRDKKLNIAQERIKTAAESDPDAGFLKRGALSLGMKGTRRIMSSTESDVAERQKRYAEVKDTNTLKLQAASAVTAAERFAAFREIAKRGDLSSYGTFHASNFENDIARYRNTGANIKELEKADARIAGYGYSGEERHQKIVEQAAKNPMTEKQMREAKGSFFGKDGRASEDTVAMLQGIIMAGDLKTQRAAIEHTSQEARDGFTKAINGLVDLAKQEGHTGDRLQMVVDLMQQDQYSSPQAQAALGKARGNKGAARRILIVGTNKDIRDAIQPGYQDEKSVAENDGAPQEEIDEAETTT